MEESAPAAASGVALAVLKPKSAAAADDDDDPPMEQYLRNDEIEMIPKYTTSKIIETMDINRMRRRHNDPLLGPWPWTAACGGSCQ